MEVIERRIYLIRGQKVMLDSGLARLCQVETFNVNKAVKRNLNRFPEDFMFQLSQEEARSLRFQLGMSKPGGGRGAGAICPPPLPSTTRPCCLPQGPAGRRGTSTRRGTTRPNVSVCSLHKT